jgi:hypothetical protein
VCLCGLSILFLKEVIAFAGAKTTVLGLDMTTSLTGFYRVYRYRNVNYLHFEHGTTVKRDALDVMLYKEEKQLQREKKQDNEISS